MEAGLVGRRVLIVDDDEKIVRSLQLFLEMEDVVVDTAWSGREALEKVAAAAPELIVLDVNMPGMNGFEVLERLKSDPATHGIPVIMLTGERESKDMLAGHDRGAACYIPKPADYNDLVDAMRLIFQNPQGSPSNPE